MPGQATVCWQMLVTEPQATPEQAALSLCVQTQVVLPGRQV
jgi:hypothetical protein